MTSGYTVQPVRLGTMSVDASQLVRGSKAGKRRKIPVLAWIIRDAKHTIVVDTGPSDAEWSNRHHNPMWRPASENVPEAFARLGVNVANITVVINTHLHWDHCYGNIHFESAQFWVQRTELQYARQPCPCDRPVYESGGPPPYERVIDRMRLIDGAEDVVPGVTVLPTPGHTPGHQSVLVAGQERRIMLAGDAVGVYENLEGKGMPGTLYTDLGEWYRSLEMMRRESDQILPGHEPAVLDEASYT